MSSIRLLGLGLIALTAAASAQSTVPWKTIKAGITSKATKPSQTLLQTPEAFANYWAKNFGQAKPPQKIDWAHSELVAIHLGHRGSGAYSANVYSVVKEGDQTFINWYERIPPAKTKEHPTATSPFIIISIPSASGNVVFRSLVEDPGNPFGKGDAFPLQTFLTGGHCLISKESSFVVDDAADLKQLWLTAFGRATPAPPADFTKWRLVAIFLGQRPTPHYELLIKRIARIGPHEVQVIYTETKPAPGSIQPQMVTNPFVILQLPKTDDQVTVERSA